MSLPELFRRYGTAVLAKNSEIAHEWIARPAGCDLTVPAPSPNGFDIRFEVELNAVTLYWGNWHTRFEPTTDVDKMIEELFGLLRDMLSPDMRIREVYAGSHPYRGYLESSDGTHWTAEHEMGLIFWNYFGKRSVKTYSNSILPGRMRKADNDAAPKL